MAQNNNILGFVLAALIISAALVLISFSNGFNITYIAGNDKFIHNGTTQIVEPYLYAVAAGETNSATVWNKWGYNSDVDSGTEEIIAHFGGDNSFILNSSEKLNITSSVSADNASGTGARSLFITGINENRTLQTELISLDGTNTVQTVYNYTGINRVIVLSTGSSISNEGDINLVSAITNKPQAQIPSGDGVTQQAFFFTQVNHTFLANYLHININKLSGGSTPRVTIRGWSRSFVTNTDYEIFRITIDTSAENTIEMSPDTPFVLGGRELLYFTAESDINNAVVSLRFSGIEKENE